MRPPSDGSLFQVIKGSAVLWNALVKSNVPDVRGVWMSEVGLQQFVVVSIKQRYPGHVTQTGLLTCQNRPAAYHGPAIGRDSGSPLPGPSRVRPGSPGNPGGSVAGIVLFHPFCRERMRPP